MKKIIAVILLFSSVANASPMTCDFSTGIVPGPNKTFVYSEICHQAVGSLVKANADLNQAIQLKDLALKMSDERVALWQKSANDSQDRLNKLSSESKHTDFLYFALGALSAIGAGYMAAKLIHP